MPLKGKQCRGLELHSFRTCIFRHGQTAGCKWDHNRFSRDAYSWEPGLRGRETVIKVLTALRKLSDVLGATTKCHLRFETFNFAAADEVVDWISNGEIHFLAFNNHLPSIRKKICEDQPLSQFLERTGLAKIDFLYLVEGLSERESETTHLIEKLAKTARKILFPWQAMTTKPVPLDNFIIP